MPRSASPSRALRTFAGIDEPIAVVRSPRRSKTVTARRRAGVFELLIPARLSQREEERWARHMYAKYGSARARPERSDEALIERAKRLADRYIPGAPQPASVCWVTNQGKRWGSCTTAEASIRLSHELRDMPQYVIDAVLVHELAHLVEPNHGPRFRDIERGYPEYERAKAFLAGVTHAKQWGLTSQ